MIQDSHFLRFVHALFEHEFTDRERAVLFRVVWYAHRLGRWPFLTRTELCRRAGIRGKDVHVVLDALVRRRCLTIEPGPEGERYLVDLTLGKAVEILTPGDAARLDTAVARANGVDQDRLDLPIEMPSLAALVAEAELQEAGPREPETCHLSPEPFIETSPFTAMRAAAGGHVGTAPEDPALHENPQLQNQTGDTQTPPDIDPENRAGSHPKIGHPHETPPADRPPENRAGKFLGKTAPRFSGGPPMLHDREHDHGLNMDHVKKARGGPARKSGGATARALLLEHVFPRLEEKFRQSWTRRLQEDPELVEIAVEEALLPRLRNGALRPADNVPAYANAFYLRKIPARRAQRMNA